MEGRLLKEDDVKTLGDLPSKEELMAQIAGALNALATKIAVGINLRFPWQRGTESSKATLLLGNDALGYNNHKSLFTGAG